MITYPKFKTEAEQKIADFMQKEISYHVDHSTGEVDRTGLAEAAANELTFDLEISEIYFEIAYEIAGVYEDAVGTYAEWREGSDDDWEYDGYDD